jgi:hypothetical protein
MNPYPYRIVCYYPLADGTLDYLCTEPGYYQTAEQAEGWAVPLRQRQPQFRFVVEQPGRMAD